MFFYTAGEAMQVPSFPCGPAQQLQHSTCAKAAAASEGLTPGKAMLEDDRRRCSGAYWFSGMVLMISESPDGVGKVRVGEQQRK